MASPREYRYPQTVDYVGPPPDPPPTGPEHASPPDYHSPPRPASWVEHPGFIDATTYQELGNEPDYGDVSTSKTTHGSSQEGGAPSQAGGAAGREGGGTVPLRPDSGGSGSSSGAAPLLREDASGVFRRMEEWEDRQTLITNAHTPPGSGEAALAMGSSLLHWKRLLGLAVPGGWAEEYVMLPGPPADLLQPPGVCKLVTSAWVLALVVAVFASVGLQWAYCEREYYGRMQVWPAATSNSSAPEYLCVHSFVWTFLVPRLLFVFGYVAIFACIFCLSAPELEYVVARTYDVITEDRPNSYSTATFIAYCRRDPRVLAFWFVVVHALSLAASLLGEGIIAWDRSEAKPPHSAALEWATFVTTCFVRLIMDSIIGHCILHYSLSIKYLELMIFRATWFLETLVTLRSNLNACQYFFTRMKIVDDCVRGAQPAVSAALLMAMLRICQVVSLVWVDQTSAPKRLTSLAQLPIAVLFFLMMLYLIRRCMSLTKTWREVFEKDPKILVLPPEPPRPDPLNLVHQFTEEQERNRATVLWHQILRECPQVAGRLMGLRAGHWMYWALLVAGALYCGGYYALLRHAPLI